MTLRALTALLVDLGNKKGVSLRRLGPKDQAPKTPKAQTPRVVVVGYTNMSVDNVLTGLLEDGFTNFARVGSLRSIDKTLLPYTVSGGRTGKEADADTLKELNAMLRENLPTAEREAVELTIAELRADTGKRSTRAAKLKEIDVIGVTCLSANSAALDTICGDQRPSIVLMDECSQMLEPMSLVALARFRAARLVAVGDPKQLPPTLRGSSSGAEERAAKLGLGKTLFTRMASAVPLILLRTQYRCHPHIADIVNGLFYGGELRTAPALESRPPIVAPLAASSFVTTAGRQDCVEMQLRSGSYSNQGEARICIQLLQELLGAHGVAPEQVGVICLYKAQASLLSQKLEQCGVGGGAILVSTVDAFQGGERDIILISATRTSGVGFTDNAERLNVALTRAKSHLVIVGNNATLSASRRWAAVMNHRSMQGGAPQQLLQHLQNNQPVVGSSGGREQPSSVVEMVGEQPPPVVEQPMPVVEEDEADMEAWAAAVAAGGSSAAVDPGIPDDLPADCAASEEGRSSTPPLGGSAASLGGGGSLW